jgi:hypothetical protein
MSLTKLSLAGSLVSDIPSGDGKTANLFLQCNGTPLLGILWDSQSVPQSMLYVDKHKDATNLSLLVYH